MAESNLQLTQKIATKAVGTPVQNWAADMRGRLIARRDSFAKMLPRSVNSDRFVAVVTSYLVQNAGTLSKCSPESLLSAVASIAQAGLDPSIPNEVNLVPFGDKASVIRGYKGYLKMARRGDDIAEIDASEFYELDTLSFSKGSKSELHHTWNIGQDRGSLRGFYAYARLKSGGCIFDVMDIPEVLSHAKRFTRASSKGPFAGLLEKGVNHENFVSYGLKTVLIRLCYRRLDMLPEVANAISEESGEPTTQIELDVEPTVEVSEQ